MSLVQPTSHLSNLQLELLKLYPFDVSDEEIKDIKKILADYFSRKIDQEMDKLWDEKGWNDQTIEYWKTERLRSSENQ